MQYHFACLWGKQYFFQQKFGWLLFVLGYTLGKVRFFLGGRAEEFWYFFQKKVLALPHVLIKKLLTPPL